MEDIKDTKEKAAELTKAEIFAERYHALCEELNLHIVGIPVHRQQENGVWGTVVEYQIFEKPAQPTAPIIDKE